ncbi:MULTISPECIES: hypothetical protein [Mycolicibacter]|uniref:Anti-sigma-28 factor FlgM C-terminal domain-containing protein n=1 Tax=[Mycobacterium] vasticus TaxID=2875777 RepID=A0ABU5Z3I1_9MYCO|nr:MULTISPECIES: hypothetical protein [unclassified Mycolicibacter]MEB3065525.1 hypothetical protein [Mycolicibacter sp. MYC101]MEB3071966.1 hypothetical protein [Mycolicibacter sp. MYC017]
MTAARKPAITRASGHPADSIPDRPESVTSPTTPPAGPAPTERLVEQHNVRIRPSVKERLSRAVDKLRYETGDRTISAASITDQALDQYLRARGC